MQVYLYCSSGHTIGLDALRRCASIANSLKEFEPILCTSDFRAGAYAKEELNINKYIPIDVITNLSNVMQKDDILIYDSTNISEALKEQIQEFCSKVYEVGVNIPYTFTNEDLYNTTNKNIKNETALFYSDDDYNETFFNNIKNQDFINMPLILGHYFFLGHEKVLKEKFKKLFTDEEYTSNIKNSKFLLTGSLNSVFESIACGNFPVLILRKDKVYDENLIKKYNIPSIKEDNFEHMLKIFKKICLDYPTLNKVEKYDIKPIIEEIRTLLNN